VNGKANQIARAAAIQVARIQAPPTTPLYLWRDGPGQDAPAAGHRHRSAESNPRAKVRYIRRAFVADVVRAYQHKSFDSLKRYYRSLDCSSSTTCSSSSANRSQEEFFYTFNALFEAHKQVPSRAIVFPRR
jgi:chromosomal replication initiator protein